ncbi:MAG: Membrane protein [Frondihabitans sp.]|nr:Membrane protein [Frondihabitans sp.]
MDQTRTNEIWILGATGRVGRALALRLASAEIPNVVLVGRSEEGLQRLVASLPAAAVTTKALANFGDMLAAVQKARPRVVVNLLGSYGETARPLAESCLPGRRYVDIANDLASVSAMAGLHDQASRAGSTLITGAGFGVLATEAVVVRLCADMPTPVRVQVDALASFASETGVVGDAFAATSVDVITSGGRVYRNGDLVPSRLGSNARKHQLPDGTSVSSAAVPSGELFVAHAASGAPSVEFTSSFAPTNPVVRAVLPLLSLLLRTVPALRRVMLTSMARSKTKAAPRPRPFSWGHSTVEWADGTTREAWLRAADAMDFTADVLLAVISALLRDDSPHGAFTPAAAFGPEIAIAAGATILAD